MPEPILPKVFISSVYRERAIPGAEKHLAIRSRIREMAGNAGIDAWIAEYSAPGLQHEHWTAIVDKCIDNLISSQVLVVLLYTRAGGAIELESEFGFASASVFEIELFYASLHLKPAFFFVVRGYEPEPELESLIRLLRMHDAASAWFVGTESDIESRIGELFAALAAGTAVGAPPPNFCDLSSDYTSSRQVEREIISETFSLVDRFAPKDSTNYSRARIAHLLEEARKAMTRTGQFSRLWMALRELCKRGIEESGADQWLEFSQLMPSAAAWLGLHGPMNVGVMAAYHTQNDLRRRGVLTNDVFPYGGFASESYSVGINHARPGWKRVRFKAAERLATRHAALHPRDPSGALAIRGSARLRLAQLGAPWLVWSALSDFREACAIKERLGASESAIGEAVFNRGMAEFAVSRMLRWKRRDALKQMRDGVKALESDARPAQAGFTVSAKRKFADALTASGMLDEAAQQRDQATALARKHGIISQLGRLQGDR
jgi:hypothetical protein